VTQHPHAELSAYIDQALDRAATAAVDGHLVTCTLCRAHVAQLRAAAALVHALPDPVPSRSLVPRLATAPSWLAPLRTLMTLASGAAVFLFIASALVSDITFLAGSGASTTAREVSGDGAARGDVPPAAAQPAATGTPLPAPTPYAAFAVSPTASTVPDAVRGPARTTTQDKSAADASPTAAPSGEPQSALAAQAAGRVSSSAPQRSPLVNPWLWLAVALVCAVIAITLQRRLRT
jgi:anti-sigma factor RsiW